ncbi:type IV secretion system DNA-binding domain-containing protein [Aeoliella sp. SH292]|uniref:type IV secretion system DNA-binding domain-containing protein n=1 Tax=Aeoliella sp. SH292 TaxID=3454464 RepID=UPI003F9CA78F
MCCCFASLCSGIRVMNSQAVVYNVKCDKIPLLASMGFDLENDILSLDPSDPTCYAWDIAADINDYSSIEKFAGEVVSASRIAEKNPNARFWEEMVRGLFSAVIISLRNRALASGEEPTWTLRDLIRALATPESIADILEHHDKGERVRTLFVDGLSDAMSRSMLMTAQLSIQRLAVVEELWSAANEGGRTISVRNWLDSCERSVLVLPQENVEIAYRPLNRALLEVLTRLLFEETNDRPRNRYFFLEDVGQADRFDGFEQLMAYGRSRAITAVLDTASKQ